jgi:hypothetical protein
MFGLARPLLIGLIGGSIFLPVFFVIWLVISYERDFITLSQEYSGPQKEDFNHFWVIPLFLFWVAGIVFGYACWNIQGALIVNLINGAVGGAFLGYWFHHHQTPNE